MSRKHNKNKGYKNTHHKNKKMRTDYDYYGDNRFVDFLYEEYYDEYYSIQNDYRQNVNTNNKSKEKVVPDFPICPVETFFENAK